MPPTKLFQITFYDLVRFSQIFRSTHVSNFRELAGYIRGMLDLPESLSGCSTGEGSRKTLYVTIRLNTPHKRPARSLTRRAR
jgi:hypothetical protein